MEHHDHYGQYAKDIHFHALTWGVTVLLFAAYEHDQAKFLQALERQQVAQALRLEKRDGHNISIENVDFSFFPHVKVIIDQTEYAVESTLSTGFRLRQIEKEEGQERLCIELDGDPETPLIPTKCLD